jgi:hypothetical protein
MRMRVLVVIVLGCLAITGVSGAATPSLYKGSAQLLLPTADETGYAQVTTQSGAGARASATYETATGTRPGFLKIALRVFKTEAAALSSFDAACAGCQLKAVGSGSWKFKQRLDVAADGNTLTLVARCRNLRVDTTQRVYGTNPHVVAGGAKRIIDGIFQKARSAGMSPCSGVGSSPPPTGSYYWSESQAEAMVVSKVRIPACNVEGADSTCGTQSAYRVVDASCRGLDEKPGTFTYSRFTCDIRAGYQGRIAGRIAVWPTGPTTLKWRIL